LYEDKGDTQISLYYDIDWVDWAGSPIDRSSTTTHCVPIGGNVTLGKARKKIMLLILAQKQNIRLWHWPRVSWCGSNNSFNN